MANEATLTVNTKITKGGINIDRQVTKTFDIAGTHDNTTVLDVPTTGVDLPLGSIATLGATMLINQDPTNYVQAGRVDGGTFRSLFRLYPGIPAAIYAEPGQTIRLVANTATCPVEIIACEA